MKFCLRRYFAFPCSLARMPENLIGPPRERRRRVRLSRRMFAVASWIACFLLLYGCGGGSATPVGTPGGQPVVMPPITSQPRPPQPETPQPGPSPPQPSQPQLPQPGPSPPQPPPLQPSPPQPSPPQPSQPGSPQPQPPQPQPPQPQPQPQPPQPQPSQPQLRQPEPPPTTQTNVFGIESSDGVDAVETLLESLDNNLTLKPLLEGHVLSYDGSADGVTGVRGKLGLPATGTGFSDATGLTEMLAKGIDDLFARGSTRGNGAGWDFPSGIKVFSNWVDGVFFGTAFDRNDDAIAPFVVGVPSGVNPVGVDGTAVWSGPVTGRELDPDRPSFGKRHADLQFPGHESRRLVRPASLL